MAEPGFIFGKGTNWTYDELQRRRAMADAMMGSLGTPKNVGEGLASIGKALAIRGINKKADKRDAELKGEFENTWARLFGGGGVGGGYGSVAPAPVNPNAPQAIADDTMRALGKEPIEPQGWKAIRNGIFAGESGGDYNALFGYSNRPGGAFAGTNLTDMTVDQALAFSDPSGPYGQHVKGQIGRVATPMGAYQVVGTTLRTAKQGLGLTGSERMTPELQDQIGQWIYKTQGTGAWEGYRGPQAGGGQGAPQINAMDIGTLAEIAGSPYATPGQRTVVQALMQQQMQGMDPSYQMGLEKQRLELEAMSNPKPGFRMTTPEEAQAYGGPGQIGPDNRYYPAGGENGGTPAAFEALKLRATAAGLQEGTPEYEQFMLTGGDGIGESRPAAFEALRQQALAAGLQEGSPDYQKFMLTKGAGDAAAAKAVGEQQGAATAAAPAEIAAADETLGYITEVRSHVGLDRGTGMSSIFNDIPGTKGYDFKNRVSQLASGAFLTAIDQLRGMGSLSNAEGQTATSAITRLDTATSKEEFLAAMADYERIVKMGRDRAQARLAGGASSGSTYTYNPATGELE